MKRTLSGLFASIAMAFVLVSATAGLAFAEDAEIDGTSEEGAIEVVEPSVDPQSISSATISLSTSTYTYNGSAKKPTPTVVLNGETLVKDTDYTVAYQNNTSAGTATVMIEGIGNYTDSASKSFTIKPMTLTSTNATMTLSTSAYTYSGAARKPAVTVTATVGGVSKTLCNARTSATGTAINLTYAAGRTIVGTYKVTATGTGNYTGTLTKYFTISKQKLSSSRVTLSTTDYTYTGTAKKPTVTVKRASGYTICNGRTTSNSAVKITYATGRTKVGKYKVTVTGTGNYTGSVTKYFTIHPGKVTLKSATAGAYSFKATWTKRVTQVTGYQICYSTSSKFSADYNKYVNVGNTSTVSKTVSGLKAGNQYYVKVRTYKTIGSTKYYSGWSSTKTVTPKSSSTAALSRSIAPPSASGSSGSDIVYLTNTGSKYHNIGCRCLSKSMIRQTLSYAQSHGYEPCKLCH